MGWTALLGHCGHMPITLHPSTPRTTPQESTRTARRGTTWRTHLAHLATTRVHALLAPLLLFAHGILAWVDGLDGTRGGGLHVVTQLVLLASVTSFGDLAVDLGARLGDRVGPILTLVGTTGVVAVIGVRLAGAPPLPTVVAFAGPALVGLGIAWLVARLVVLDLHPLGALTTALVGGLVLASPWELLPLGALLVLVGLGPLTRDLEPHPDLPSGNPPTGASR